MEYEFVTVDVFTDRRFGGNPLAVFPDAQGITDADMLALAGEFNLSEITFVLPPTDPTHTARVRIFGPRAELPFAGHPNIGTALVIAGRRGLDRVMFEEWAGLVRIEVTDGRATLVAPRPLERAAEVPVATVAACLGLRPRDIVTGAHSPCVASVGLGFAFAEVTPDALSRCVTDTVAFRDAAEHYATREGGFALYVYTRDGQTIRARMFAPLAGIPEDPATGSANAALAALLLSLSGGDRLALTVHQGVEMGRPSLLLAAAERTAEGIMGAVGGGAVPVMRGVVAL